MLPKSESILLHGHLRARSEVELLQAYSAPLEGRRQSLRLDFNENTIGPSPLVIQALRSISPEQVAVYPEYDGLREAVIANLSRLDLACNILTSQVGLFNGVDAAIHAIFHAYGDRGDQFLTTTPTFGYYIPCANMQGMEIKTIPYHGLSYEFPFEKISKSLHDLKPKIFFICNPNNPTGTRLKPEKIFELSTISPNTLLIIDELYEAFTGDSALPLIDFYKIPNVVILRSLSKTAGLAGLRVGFAIGHESIIDRITRVTGPYDINSFAVTAAFAALKDQPYIDQYVDQVLKAREWIRSQLMNNQIRHHIDGGNYFLVWPRANPHDVVQGLREQGILVRDMSEKPLIEGSLRVTIGTTNQMKVFWKTFYSLENRELVD